jgi:multimeric flavodoxin WrbA
MKNILVISTSLRNGSNSEILADKFIEGALDNGNNVEKITLKNKKLNFCVGCLTCQRTLECIFKDDANQIVSKMKNADVLVFATPIYYYEMSGQMKTLLDRANPLYPA